MAVSVLDFSAGGGQFRRGMSLLTAYRLNSGLYVECAILLWTSRSLTHRLNATKERQLFHKAA
jgi:hypothetical protein